MIKKLLFIAVHIMLLQPLFAQRISMSEKEELSTRNDDFMVIGKYKQYLLTYRKHLGVSEVIFYSNNFSKEKISTLTFLPDNISSIHFSNSANNLVVYYIVHENRKSSLSMAMLNEDFTWTTPKLIDACATTAYRFNSDYNYTISEDRTKTLCHFAFIEGGQMKLHARVFNEKGDLLSSIDQAFTDKELFVDDESAISNEGKAVIFATERNSERAGSDKLTLLTANAGSAEFTANSLELNNYSLSDIHLQIDNINNNVYTCSYFSDGRYNRPRGFYFSCFSLTKDAIVSSFFTPVALQISQSGSDLRDMIIRKLFIKKTGEINIVAEKTYQRTATINTNAPNTSTSFMLSNIPESSRTIQEYSNDEILVFNLKPDGSLSWNQTVLKEQTTYDDQGIFSSFGVLQHRLGTVFIFNDVNERQPRLLSAYISGKGELAIKELQTLEDTDRWDLMPRSLVQISKSEIVMPCVSKNYLCFLKISY